MIKLSKRVKEMCEAMGWRQKRLAKMSGIDEGRMSKIFNGAEPSTTEMQKLCDIHLKLGFDEMWERIEESEKTGFPEKVN